MKTALAVSVLVVSLVQLSFAQIHGLGFVQGKVADDKGAALRDVAFTAVLPRVGGRIVGKTDDKGEWRVIGMAHGEWDIVFEKRGYVVNKVHVSLEPELVRIPKIGVLLVKAASKNTPDASETIAR